MDNELRQNGMEPDFSWGKDDRVFPKPETVEPDFSWTEEKGYDIELNERNPHDCKDELAQQWFGGKDNILYTRENNVTERMKTAKTVIVQKARDLLNGGHTPAFIRERLAQTVNPFLLRHFEKDVNTQLGFYGSVGRFVLDARGYKNCAEAAESLKSNPFKKYVAHVMGCKCGSHKMVSKKASASFALASDGDLVASTTGGDKIESYEACSQTAMKIISGQGDIDESWAGDTMIDVMNASGKDMDKGKAFTASAEQPYLKLKKFFAAIDEGILDRGNELQESCQTEDYSSEAPAIVVLDPQALLSVEVDNNGQDFGLFKEDQTPAVGALDIEDVPSNLQIGLQDQAPDLSMNQVNQAPMDLEIENAMPDLDFEAPESEMGMVLNPDQKAQEALVLEVDGDMEDIAFEKPEVLDISF